MNVINPFLKVFLGLILCYSSVSLGEVRRTSYYYLRCNSTSWDITPESKHQLQAKASGDRLELVVEIWDPEIIRNTDDCALTRTSQQGQWGTDYEHMRVMQTQMEVPAASWIYNNHTSDEPHFRVRYPAPGRYRIRFFVRDALLVITPESGTTKAGELNWALPGRLFQGAKASLFRQSDGWNPDTQKNQSMLALLNPETGDDLWQYSIKEGYLSPSTECSRRDAILANTDRELVSFERGTGRILWSHAINQEFRAEYPVLSMSCPQDSALVYVSYGTLEDPRFAVLDANDGRKLWSLKDQQLLYTPNLNSKTVVLYRDITDYNYPQASKRIFTAVDVATGQVLWVRSESSFTALYQDQEGRVYLTTENSWQRLQEGQGKTLWRFDTQGHWISPAFEKSGLFALDGHVLRKLDPTTGRIQWTYEGTSQQYLAPNYVSEDKILIREGYSVFVLDGQTGEKLWERTFENQSFPPNVSSDKQGRIYVSGTGWMKRLALRDGSDIWTYHLTGVENPQENSGRWTVQSVADSDGQNLYALFSGSGYRCPPMGIVSLEAATGRARWKRLHGGPLWVAASDANRVYLAEGCQGPLVFKSVQK